MAEHENENYRMDRSVMKPMSFEEADDHVGYWKDKSVSERINAACFIINQIYGTTPQTKVDRTVFEKRHRE
jgi:hypothetical protein